MSKSNYTVLIVDYDPRNVETVRRLLEREGCNVEVAHDGVSGLQAFARLKPDLVLIEAMLPKKHGFEVCQDIKKSNHGKGTPVIITTAVYRGRKYRTQAIHVYGCDEYLEKPIQEDKLLATCKELMNRVGKNLDNQRARERPTSRPAASSNKKPGRKKSEMPTAVVNELTEEEIMARLDALLPGEELSDESGVAAPAAHASDISVGGAIESPGERQPSPHAGESRDDDAQQTGHVIHQVHGSTAPEPVYRTESAPEENVDESVDEVAEKPKLSSQVVPFEDKRGRRGKESRPGDDVEGTPGDLESELEEITSVLEDGAPDRDEATTATDAVGPLTTAGETDSRGADDQTDAEEEGVKFEAIDSPFGEDDAEAADDEDVDVDVAVAEILSDESEVTELTEAVAESDTPAEFAAAGDAHEEIGTETIGRVEKKSGSGSKMVWIVVVIMIVAGAAAGAYFFLSSGTVSLPGFGKAPEETSRLESTSRTTPSPAAVFPPPTRPATTPEIDPLLDGQSETTGAGSELAGAGTETTARTNTKPTAVESAAPTPTNPPSSISGTPSTAKSRSPKPQPTRSASTKTEPPASKPEPAVTPTRVPEKTEPAAAARRDPEPAPATSSDVIEPAPAPVLEKPEPVVEDRAAVAKEEGDLVASSTPALSDRSNLGASTEATKPAIEKPDPIVRDEPEPAPPPAPKKASAGDLIEIQNLDTEPVPDSRAAPIYPPLALRARREGTAIFNVLIDEKGRVAEVEVIKEIGRQDMDEAALDAVRNWTFKPATKDGVPVKVWKVEKVVFKL